MQTCHIVMLIKNHMADVVVKGKADPSEMKTLRDLVNHLSVCVVSKKSKNVEVLHIAAEVTGIFS